MGTRSPSSTTDPLLKSLVAASDDHSSVDLLAAVAAALLVRSRLELTLDDLAVELAAPSLPAVRALAAIELPDEPPSLVLGRAHEVLLGRDERRGRGAFYTPPAIADGVVGMVMVGWDVEQPTVCDPSVGGGAFLLASARALVARKLHPATIVRELLFGVDVDPIAVAVTRSALVMWAAERGAVVRVDEVANHVVVGDALLDGRPEAWRDLDDGFDAIVGNPPFLNQLESGTARSRSDREALRQRFGEAAHRYTDTAALFLLESCRWARLGGRVALVLPEPVLVSGDARVARDEVATIGRVRGFWSTDESVFGANVRVCAPVVEVGVVPDARPIERWVGPDFTPADPIVGAPVVGAATWAGLRNAGRTHPRVQLRPRGRLGDLCTATAGFRDQFYGIAPFVREAVDGERGTTAKLVTSGLVEPGSCRWGHRPTRFAGTSWRRPVVDVDALRRSGAAALVAWTEARLIPKVVVATQTRVIEAVVDEDGSWFPSVPTVALEPCGDGMGQGPDGQSLWMVLAAVLAPPVTAWAVERHGGAAMSADAIKLSASQLLDVPLPSDVVAWRAGAAAAREAACAADEASWRTHLVTCGRALTAAHAIGGSDADAVIEWWEARLPTWTRTRSRPTTANALTEAALTVAHPT